MNMRKTLDIPSDLLAQDYDSLIEMSQTDPMYYSYCSLDEFWIEYISQFEEEDLQSLFEYCVKNNQLNIVHGLINNPNVDIRANDDHALRYAVGRDNLHLTNMLIESEDGQFIHLDKYIIHAIDNKQPQMARLLLDHTQLTEKQLERYIAKSEGDENEEMLDLFVNRR